MVSFCFAGNLWLPFPDSGSFNSISLLTVFLHYHSPLLDNMLFASLPTILHISWHPDLTVLLSMLFFFQSGGRLHTLQYCMPFLGKKKKNQKFLFSPCYLVNLLIGPSSDFTAPQRFWGYVSSVIWRFLWLVLTQGINIEFSCRISRNVFIQEYCRVDPGTYHVPLAPELPLLSVS